MTEREIKTEYVYPPIPIRDWDWCAYFDGDEEGGPVGWGKTKDEALADLAAKIDEGEQ